jgi:hypothetical protein
VTGKDPQGGFHRDLGVFPMIAADVAPPASAPRRTTSGEFIFGRETSLHNSEIRKVAPGFMGTLLVYEK